jgi:hypothetical protein
MHQWCGEGAPEPATEQTATSKDGAGVGE